MSGLSIPETESAVRNRIFRASLSEIELAAYDKMVEIKTTAMYEAARGAKLGARPFDVYRQSVETSISANWDELKQNALNELGESGKAASR